MSSVVGDRQGKLDVSGGSGLARLARLAAVAAGLLTLLVLLPMAMTYINPGHVGSVIHRVGGGKR